MMRRENYGNRRAPARNNPTHTRVFKGFLTPFEKKICLAVVVYGMKPHQAWRFAGGRCTPIQYAEGRPRHMWKRSAGTMYWRLLNNGAFAKMADDLQTLVKPAIASLRDVLANSENDGARVKAAELVLNRTGHGPTSTIRHESAGSDFEKNKKDLIALLGEEKAAGLMAQMGLVEAEVVPIEFKEVKG